MSTNPPVAKRRMHSSTWHGRTISDPYHWLRDTNYPDVSNPEILDYLTAENSYFDQVFEPDQPLVQALFDELKARQPDAEESVPYLYRGFHYQWRFAPGGQYRTWYRAPQAQPKQWQVLLDEPELAQGSEYFRLGGITVSPNNQLLAFSIDNDGAERYTLQLRSLSDTPAPNLRIENTLGSVVWAADSQSFYYVALNDQWRPFQVRRQFIAGEHEGGDQVVFEEPDESFFVGIDETQSERFLVISSGDHVTNECWILDHRTGSSTSPLCIAPRRPHHEYSLDHRADTFYILTNRRHANFDLMTAPESTPQEANWQRFQDGSDTLYLTDHLCLDDYVIVEQRCQGLDEIRVMPIDGEPHIIDFPDAVGCAGLGTNPSAATQTLRVHYESMVRPATVYDYDLNSKQLTTLKVEEIPSGYDGSKYRTERLLISARDGAEVPVSIVWSVDNPPSPNTPLYLYAYGAYGHAIPPAFSRNRLSLLERGFSYAIAHIRGGDDLGYHWYTEGKLNKRTNTFNDFVDVARGLINKGYAKEGAIGIAGGSAGGELMGAVVNQAPQLWGAVAAHVPFVDVLNTMLDASLPLTPIEWPEWGNPIEDPDAFEHILSYSPYDQLTVGDFPPIMVTAGLNDPRVTYWEPAKYVAKIRHLQQNDSPIVLKTNMGAGHGGKSGRFEALREVAEEYTFMIRHVKPSS